MPRRRERSRFGWNVDAPDLAEAFLASAVAAVLAIRAYLAATGYPKLGGSSLHIAHVLWGGLLMAAGLLMLLVLIGSASRMVAAVLGGIGFGAFIDEIGKFLTHDNDYFFRPAIALIYAVFVVLFLVVRALPRDRHWSRAERLAYVYSALTDLALGRLSRKRRRRTLLLLEALGDGHSRESGNDEDERLVALRTLLAAPNAALTDRSGWATRLARIGDGVVEGLEGFAADARTRRVVLGLFFVLTCAMISGIVAALVADFSPELDVATLGSGSSLAAVGLLSLAGVVALLRGARGRALALFYRATQISIFFAQFFAFVAVQLLALPGLALNLLVLVALRVEIAVDGAHEGRTMPP
jgi:hypothetical protein